ncbi:MAG: hypothetical protein NTY12_02645 [Candidatus Falkowbacteria bacterium]|nr:hypothetical protein [Candidatus Falkowbacteria bacterium]
MKLTLLKISRYISLIVFVFSLSACGSNQNVEQVKTELTIPPGKILFISKTCSHCALVKQYISDNKVLAKTYFVERDITSDQEAYQIMPLVGQRCGFTESNLGVPLFWDGTKCYLGDENIINYFKTLP